MEQTTLNCCEETETILIELSPLAVAMRLLVGDFAHEAEYIVRVCKAGYVEAKMYESESSVQILSDLSSLTETIESPVALKSIAHTVDLWPSSV